MMNYMLNTEYLGKLIKRRVFNSLKNHSKIREKLIFLQRRIKLYLGRKLIYKFLNLGRLFKSRLNISYLTIQKYFMEWNRRSFMVKIYSKTTKLNKKFTKFTDDQRHKLIVKEKFFCLKRTIIWKYFKDLIIGRKCQLFLSNINMQNVQRYCILNKSRAKLLKKFSKRINKILRFRDKFKLRRFRLWYFISLKEKVNVNFIFI